MNRDDLNKEWRDLAPGWIKESREGKNTHRSGLLDESTLVTCGNVEGLSVIDCGCGEGRFSRMLSARGASYVLGIDLCEPMIEAAKELQTERDEYRLADAQDLSFIEDNSFDLAVSYLNQCDLPNHNENTIEVYRILKSGGRFIIVNLHPMRSAAGVWLKTDDGVKQHVILDNYFDEGGRHWECRGLPLTNYHRSLSTYIKGFLEAGFSIEAIKEPTVTEEQLALYPELDDELRVPNFIIFVLRKP